VVNSVKDPLLQHFWQTVCWCRKSESAHLCCRRAVPAPVINI